MKFLSSEFRYILKGSLCVGIILIVLFGSFLPVAGLPVASAILLIGQVISLNSNMMTIRKRRTVEL